MRKPRLIRSFPGTILRWTGKECELHHGELARVTANWNTGISISIEPVSGRSMKNEDRHGWYASEPFELVRHPETV